MSDQRQTSVKTRFIGILLGMGIAIIILFLSVLVFTFQNNMQNNALAHIKNIQGFYNGLVEENIKMLAAALNTFAQDKAFQDLFVARKRDQLLAATTPLFHSNRDAYGITHFYFIDTDGKCFLRVHNPELAGDLIDRKTYQQARATQRISSGIELGQTAYALRVIMPYLSAGKSIGYIEFGEEIDSFNKVIKDKTGTNVVVLAYKELLNHQKYADVRSRAGMQDDWESLKKYVILSNTLKQPERFTKYFFNASEIAGITAPTYLGHVHNNGQVLMKGAFPLYDVGKHPTGVIFTLTDITEQVYTFWITMLSVAIIGILLLIAFFMAALRNLQTHILDPLHKLTALADNISKGKNLDHELTTDRTDEIGSLTRAFDRMRASTNKLTKRLLGDG